MAEDFRNLIQYIGLTDQAPETSKVFKQLNVETTYCLPDAKPDIEQIMKIMNEVVIKSTKVIKTPKGVSLEGQALSGWKLVVEGVAKEKIQYVGDLAEQSVHAAHANIPFSTYIILPESFLPGTLTTVHSYVEDIYAQKMDERCVFINITLVLTADFC